MGLLAAELGAAVAVKSNFWLTEAEVTGVLVWIFGFTAGMAACRLLYWLLRGI